MSNSNYRKPITEGTTKSLVKLEVTTDRPIVSPPSVADQLKKFLVCHPPTIDQVKEFHDAFGLISKDVPDISDEKLNKLRLKLLQEELIELEDELSAGNIVGVLDALSDLQYVLDGAYLAFGLANVKDKAFQEVHNSNMSKLGEDGKPIYREDGKVLKGPNFKEPNLEQFIVIKEIQ